MRNVWTKEPANEWNGMETKKQMNEQAWFDACVSVCASTMYIYVSVHEATSICGACVLVLLQNWTEHVAKQHRTHIHFIVAVVVVVIVKVMLVQMVWSLVAVLLLFSLLSLLNSSLSPPLHVFLEKNACERKSQRDRLFVAVVEMRLDKHGI